MFDFLKQLTDPESIIQFGGMALLLFVVFAETGLLIGFFGIDKLFGFYSLVVWGFAILCFVSCIIATMFFFSKNTEHLRCVVERNNKAKVLKKSLTRTSDIAAISFICGIILVVALAICESKFVTKRDSSQPQVIQLLPFNPYKFHHKQHERHDEQCAKKEELKEQMTEKKSEEKLVEAKKSEPTKQEKTSAKKQNRKNH